MKFHTENKVLTMFSVSSLTDVVFLLLIFFLISSSFIVYPGIRVQLPSAEQTTPQSEKQITLTITENGLYYINSQRVLLKELGEQLSEKLGNEKDKLIIINADKSISLQRAIEVMDIAKSIGASKFLIATVQQQHTSRK
ncbi:MAG: biopolymer transporter ExbD [Ignavibacteria bacterium]|nr:biopolymer transporter ExbD [Ignavibacteria bacterium]